VQPVHKKYLTIWITVWASSLAVLFVLHVFLLTPQKRALAVLEEKLEEKKEEYNASKVADSMQVQAQWREKMNRLNRKLGNFVAEPNDLDSLAFGISKIARQIRVTEFSSKAESGESYFEIPNCYRIGRAGTNVSFYTTFNKFARFINALERHRPTIFIEEFTICRSEKDYWEHRANLLLSVLIRLPQADESGE